METGGVSTGSTVDTGATGSVATEGLPQDIGGDEGLEAKAETAKEAEKRKFKAKVNGREVEVDEDTLIKNWQKYEAADEKFRAAAEKEKKYGKYVDLDEAFQKKDLSVLSKYIDPDTIREFSEKQLLDYLEYQGLSDDQKAIIEKDKKLKEYQDRDEEQKRAQEEERKAQISMQAAKFIDDEISGVFKELGKKPTPAEIIRLAMQMNASLSQGKVMGAKEAYQKVSTEMKGELSGWLQSVPPKELANILPKSVIDAIRRQSVEEATQAPFARSARQENQTKPGGKIRTTTDDFFKQLDQKYQGR